MAGIGGRISAFAANAVSSTNLTQLITRMTNAFTEDEAKGMSPGAPIQPVAPDAEPRRQQYQVGQNLSTQPRTNFATSFDMLRFFSTQYPIAAICINTRIETLAGLDWQFHAKDKKARKTGKFKDQIDKATQFWQRPDGQNDWTSWLRMALRDRLEIDALTLYPRKTRGGDLHSVEIIDGSTIKVLIDNRGRVPDAPTPAYQQVLWGVPQSLWTRDQLLYRPQNVQSYSVYGRAEVETILIIVNTAMRKQIQDLLHFTDSNIPRALISTPADWTPSQIEQFQTFWDEWLTGDQARKSKMILAPGTGAAGRLGVYEFASFSGDISFDEWLMKLTCAALQTTPSEIGFTDDSNKATAGSQERVQARGGTQPLAKFVTGIVNEINRDYLDCPDITHEWDTSEEEDNLMLAQVDEIYSRLGVMQPDEMREKLGLDPYKAPPFMIFNGEPVLVDQVEAYANAILQEKILIGAAGPGSPGGVASASLSSGGGAPPSVDQNGGVPTNDVSGAPRDPNLPSTMPSSYAQKGLAKSMESIGGGGEPVHLGSEHLGEKGIVPKGGAEGYANGWTGYPHTGPKFPGYAQNAHHAASGYSIHQKGDNWHLLDPHGTPTASTPVAGITGVTHGPSRSALSHWANAKVPAIHATSAPWVPPTPIVQPPQFRPKAPASLPPLDTTNLGRLKPAAFDARHAKSTAMLRSIDRDAYQRPLYDHTYQDEPHFTDAQHQYVNEVDHSKNQGNEIHRLASQDPRFKQNREFINRALARWQLTGLGHRGGVEGYQDHMDTIAALHLATRDEFNTHEPHDTSWMGRSQATSKEYDRDPESYKALVRAMYEHTQDHLMRSGITGNVEIHRAQENALNHKRATALQPLNSFSPVNMPGYGKYHIAASVPTTRILHYLHQYPEYLVIGGKHGGEIAQRRLSKEEAEKAVGRDDQDEEFYEDKIPYEPEELDGLRQRREDKRPAPPVNTPATTVVNVHPARDDLRRWRSKVLKAAKSGRALPGFASAVIPQPLAEILQGDLDKLVPGGHPDAYREAIVKAFDTAFDILNDTRDESLFMKNSEPVLEYIAQEREAVARMHGFESWSAAWAEGPVTLGG